MAHYFCMITVTNYLCGHSDGSLLFFILYCVLLLVCSVNMQVVCIWVTLAESRRVMRGVTQEQVLAAENDGTTPEKLAVNLLLALFTESELSTGNCKDTNDIPEESRKCDWTSCS